jgi:IMP dehydrogenase
VNNMGINISDKTYLGYDDVFIIPQYSDVETRQQVSTKTILKGVHSKLDITLETPVISANMDTITEHEMAICLAKQGAQGALHRFLTKEQNVEQYRLVQEAGQDCFVSIGVSPEDRERAILLFYAGARRFIVDIAHGHSLKMRETITWLRTNFGNEVFIVAGNVATGEAACTLEAWGADAIKVGIGPGFVCTTKDVTGVTVPIFGCVEECITPTSGSINIIADGGARAYGDIAKAIGLGAKAVMSGYFFAG